MRKKTHWITASLAATIIVFAGCSSGGPSNPNSASASSAGHSDDEFQPPVRGETKDQVVAQYDDPDQVFQTSEGGETWIYVIGKGKLYIPFYGSFAHLRYLTIYFDPSGRVSSWETATHPAF